MLNVPSKKKILLGNSILQLIKRITYSELPHSFYNVSIVKLYQMLHFDQFMI